MMMAHRDKVEIDLEFQPNLRRISVQNVNKMTTTVDEALDKFAQQAGVLRTSIKRAVPYRPVFSDLSASGKFLTLRVILLAALTDAL